MAILLAESKREMCGVEVNEFLLTKHNPKGIAMPKSNITDCIGVTIHNTDWISVASGTTPAEQYTRATLNGNMKDVRVHFYVDDVCAWQNLPLTLQGWHAADGSGNGNRKTIAIECIMGSGNDARYEKAEDNCARLAAQLLFDMGKGTESLYTHTHWLNVKAGKTGTLDYLNTAKSPVKYCPVYILPHWQAFVAKVQAYLVMLGGDGVVGKPATTTPVVIREGMTGTEVKKMQTALIEAGFLRPTESDGDFGKITLGAVLAYQMKNNLEVDGICGPATRRSLGI